MRRSNPAKGFYNQPIIPPKGTRVARTKRLLSEWFDLSESQADTHLRDLTDAEADLLGALFLKGKGLTGNDIRAAKNHKYYANFENLIYSGGVLNQYIVSILESMINKNVKPYDALTLIIGLAQYYKLAELKDIVNTKSKELKISELEAMSVLMLEHNELPRPGV